MALRSTTTTSFLGFTSLAATAPAGMAAGDRLLALMTCDVFGAVVTQPSGFAVIGDASPSAPDGQKILACEKKLAAGADSLTWTIDAVHGAIIQVAAYTGRHTTTAATVQTTINTTSNATPITVALTGVTAANGDDVIAMASLDQQAQNDQWSYTSPSGYTERQDSANNDWCSASIATVDNVSAGATGTLSFTATRNVGAANAGWGGVVVAIPAALLPIRPKLTLLGAG